MLFLDLDTGARIFHFESLAARPEIEHFISTRDGGVSPPPYASLNVSFATGHARENVVENRDRVCRGLDIDLDAMTAGKQVHGCDVRVVDPAMAGRGARDFTSAFEATDAMVTAERGVCLTVLAADCVPILAYDPRRGVLGAAHAGWRGTVAGMAGHLVDVLGQEFGCRPADLMVGIGPSIGPEDYEVGDEVVAQLKLTFSDTWESLVRPKAHGKALIDLWTANRIQLERAGVAPDQIEIAGISTYASVDSFFSERREGRPCGRFMAGIMLR